MDKLYNNTIYAMSDAEIVRALGLRFRQYRLRMDLTQRDVSFRTGLSVATIHKFETGTAANISLTALLALMRCTDMLEAVENIFPALPPSPYLDMRRGKLKQRVKPSKSKSTGQK